MRPVTQIARSGELFRSFGPYVPSVNADGIVAFQATLRAGESAIAMGDGASPRVIASDLAFRSHPAIAGSELSAYAAERTLWTFGKDTSRAVELTGEIGPLGPTMNDAGEIAYRSEGGIFLARGDAHRCVAKAIDFKAFHGLPVVTSNGSVVFRADTEEGPCILRWQGDARVVVRDVLGRFPSADDARIAFVRESGVFIAEGEETRCVVPRSARFAHFRGVLIAGRHLVFYAARENGPLGVYLGEEGIPLLALGDTLFGSTVVDFALNPVSIHASGVLAIRVTLAEGSEHILRMALQ
jgi:hypothetical protein